MQVLDNDILWLTTRKSTNWHSSMTTTAVPVIKGLSEVSLEDSLILHTVVCKQYMKLKIATVSSAALHRWSCTNYQENIGEIHYHKENKTTGGKQIEFSAESNHFEKKTTKLGINEMFSYC